MQNVELFRELLKIEPPWQILSIVVSPEEKKLDINLGYKGVEKKSFFRFARKKSSFGTGGKTTCPHCQTTLPLNGEFSTVSVRHLSTAEYSTYLHVPVSGTVNSFKTNCVCMRQWRKPGTDCTKEFFDMTVEMITAFRDIEKVGNILKLTADEMKMVLETSDFPDGNDAMQKSSGIKGTAITIGIPEFANPNWLQLVKGELTIQSKVVAFSMLLSRVQAAYLKKPTIDTEVSGVKILRQFFKRNERLLKREIAILKSTAESSYETKILKQEPSDSNIPEESAIVWQQFAKGDLSITTKHVALQMLLRQIQNSLIQNPTEAAIHAGIRIVRNYFVKNERLLGDEIAQLKKLG